MKDIEEARRWRDEAQAAALEDIAEWGPGRRARIFTDGLGALGVGCSLTDPDSEGNFKQRVYDKVVFDQSYPIFMPDEDGYEEALAAGR